MEKIMSFCEDNNVDYIFSMVRNKRFYKAIIRKLRPETKDIKGCKSYTTPSLFVKCC